MRRLALAEAVELVVCGIALPVEPVLIAGFVVDIAALDDVVAKLNKSPLCHGKGVPHALHKFLGAVPTAVEQ